MSTRARIISSILVLALFLDCGAGISGAVTFDSKPTDGSQSSTPPPKVLGDSPSSGKSSEGALLYNLDVPQTQKERLARSIQMLHLTGLQATMAVDTLKSLENKSLPDDEILARLVHAEESLEAVERAAKKLNDDVELVRIACDNNPELRKEIFVFMQQFFCNTCAGLYW